MPKSPDTQPLSLTDIHNLEYYTSSNQLGTRSSTVDTANFVRRAGLPPETFPAIRREFNSGPDSHLYDGVTEGLTDFVSQGDTVQIWTVGETHGIPEENIPGYFVQHRKIAKSGLKRRIADATNLDRAEMNRRFRVYSTDFDKPAQIPQLILDAQADDYSHIQIADDKTSNLLEVKEKIRALQEAGQLTADVQVVWMNQGRSMNKLPSLYTGTQEEFIEEYEITVANNFDEYRSITTANRNKLGTRIFHILDWDHTLADETERKDEIGRNIAEKFGHVPRDTEYLERDDPRQKSISRVTNNNPDTVLIRQESNGMHGGVYSVYGDTPAKARAVKFETKPEKQHRITGEIDGYQILSNTAYARHLALIQESGTNDDELGAYLVMERIRGADGRVTLSSGQATVEQSRQIAARLMQIQEEHYTSVGKVVNDGEWFSMQKAEAEDTESRMLGVFGSLSNHLGIPSEEVATLPIRVINNKGTFPTLPLQAQLRQYGHEVNDPPPVLLEAAHNDLSAANTIVDLHDDEVDIKIIDPQWAKRKSDPAADLVRTIKHDSCSTVDTKDASIQLSPEGDCIVVDTTQVIVPETIQAAQRVALEPIEKFGTILGDPSFRSSVDRQMHASYVRELAIRGDQITNAAYAIAKLAEFSPRDDL